MNAIVNNIQTCKCGYILSIIIIIPYKNAISMYALHIHII